MLCCKEPKPWFDVKKRICTKFLRHWERAETDHQPEVFVSWQFNILKRNQVHHLLKTEIVMHDAVELSAVRRVVKHFRQKQRLKYGWHGTLSMLKIDEYIVIFFQNGKEFERSYQGGNGYFHTRLKLPCHRILENSLKFRFRTIRCWE